MRSMMAALSWLFFLGFRHARSRSASAYPTGQIATILGLVALKWNDIQFFVFVMFWRLLDKSPNAEAVFFAVRTDRAQRDMTVALAKDVLKATPDLMNRVVNLLADISRMAGRRNDVIHGCGAWTIQTFSQPLPRQQSPLERQEHPSRTRGHPERSV